MEMFVKKSSHKRKMYRNSFNFIKIINNHTVLNFPQTKSVYLFIYSLNIFFYFIFQGIFNLVVKQKLPRLLPIVTNKYHKAFFR